MDSAPKGGTIQSEAGAICFIFMIFFLNMLSRLGLAPFLPGIENELSLTHTDTGALFLFISLGYGIGLFCSTIISAYLSHHRQISFSAIAVGMSLLLLSLSYNIWALRLLFAVLGFSGGLCLPSSVAILTSLVRYQDWGKVLAIQQLAPNLAYICSPLFANIILNNFSWRFAVTAYGIASILMGGIFFLFNNLSVYYGKAPSFKLIRHLVLKPPFLIMIILFSVALGVNQGFFSIAPLYLTVERQLESGFTNQLLTISRIFAFGMPLLAGWASDKYGLKKILYITMSASSLATILVTAVPVGWLGPGLILQAVASVCFFPLGFAVLSHITSQQNRNIAVAFTIPFSHFIGVGIVPTLIGFSGDAGSFGWGIGALGAITAIGLLLLRYLHVGKEKG